MAQIIAPRGVEGTPIDILDFKHRNDHGVVSEMTATACIYSRVETIQFFLTNYPPDPLPSIIS